MAYQDAELLRDRNGNPIPQYFNVATGQFEPITGKDGAQNTQLTGSNMEDGLPVSLKGRNVEQVTLVDALAFRGETGLMAQEPFNAQPYKDFEISFRNSLKDENGDGVAVSVGFVTNGATEVHLKDGRSVLYSYYTQGGRVWHEVPGNDRLYYLVDLPIVGRSSTEDAELYTPNIWKLYKSNNNTPAIAFGLVDRGKTPVEGTFSCWLDGVKN